MRGAEQRILLCRVKLKMEEDGKLVGSQRRGAKYDTLKYAVQMRSFMLFTKKDK